MHPLFEKSDFHAYLEELLTVPSSDILVHCTQENKQLVYLERNLVSPVTFTLTPEWKRLLAFASSVQKSADTNTLCIAFDTVTWLDNQQTPIWLVPVRYRTPKNASTIEITFELEDAFINPYLAIEFKRVHGELLETVSRDNFEQKRPYVAERLQALSYAISELAIIGNFHHHRFLLVKELEELQAQTPSTLVQSMLGNEHNSQDVQLVFEEGNLTLLDRDQKQVIEQLISSNCVVEGPPGTGKSELITTILGKCLTSTKSQLVVSEKKTALDVIAKKLAKHGLDPYAFVVTSETRSKDLIAKLIETWRLLENNVQEVRSPIYIGQQKRTNLQLLLDKLTAKELVGGISYSAFLGMLTGKDLTDVPYISNVPSLKEWSQEKAKIAEFYAQNPPVEVLSYFQKVCFETSVKLDEVIAQFQHESTFLHETFGVTSVAEVEELISEVIYAQILENEIVKKQVALFEKDTMRKKFKKRYFELQQKRNEKALCLHEMSVWKSVPTELQVKTWEKNLSSGSWWTRRKTQKQISKQLTDSTLPIKELIQHVQKYLEVTAAISQLEIDLLHLGVQPIPAELESIYTCIRHWESSDESKRKLIAKRPVEYRQKLIVSRQRIKQFLQNVHIYFTLTSHFSILEFANLLTRYYSTILSFSSLLNKLPISVYGLLQQANTIEELEKLILKSHLVQLENLFPVLRSFSGEELAKKLDVLIETENSDNQLFVNYIHAKRAARFHAFHGLLQTPSTKLCVEEKELKVRLKKGKSILVKEFAKTRHTKTIRELLNSEAKDWIKVVLPIWLCTPGQVATSFPMTPSLFELVIIDEASQLPLTHALGALQRGERALVCGDSKQMSPGSYFSKKTEQIDVLHHASYYWKTCMLTHHYRSQHPALIAFSNKHFYQNKLIAYPTALQGSYPIQVNYCATGTFVERKNIQEAKEIAHAIEKQLLLSEDSIGVVAFSQEQLTCIWDNLSPISQEKVTQNLEYGKGFFKTLEQVQGEECEQLFISIGYGKNEAGKFQLRMGPLNRRNGYRRLNVLFTRAQKRIHLFTSVTSRDFPISENESMQLLRLYLQDAEQKGIENNLNFPYALTPKHVVDNHVSFDSIYDTLYQAEELINFHYVMLNRGWIVNY